MSNINDVEKNPVIIYFRKRAYYGKNPVIIRFRKNIYSCHICEDTFKIRIHLKNHIENFH